MRIEQTDSIESRVFSDIFLVTSKEVIFEQGRTIQGAFMLTQGLVEFRVQSPKGKQATIGTLSAPAFLGSAAFGKNPEDQKHPYSATALTDCVLKRYSLPDLSALFSDDSDAASTQRRVIMRSLVDEETMMMHMLSEYPLATVPQRITRSLLRLLPLDIKSTHEDIARFAGGVSREITTTVLNDLLKKGVLIKDAKGHITVKDIKGFEKITQGVEKVLYQPRRKRK